MSTRTYKVLRHPLRAMMATPWPGLGYSPLMREGEMELALRHPSPHSRASERDLAYDLAEAARVEREIWAFTNTNPRESESERALTEELARLTYDWYPSRRR